MSCKNKNTIKSCKSSCKKRKDGTKSFILNHEEEINNFLKKFPIEDVWGVGRKISKLYKNNNILTAYDLKNANNTWIKNTNVLGLKTVMELRNISCIDFESSLVQEKIVVYQDHLEKRF